MAFDRADAAQQVTLLRDSKSRFGIAIGETPAGVSITKIGACDALPSGGQLDERARLAVGDLVLRVDNVPLVDERGRPVDMPLDDVKGLIKAAGDYLTLEVRRPVAQPSMPPPPAARQQAAPAAATEPASGHAAVTGRADGPSVEVVTLKRDEQGRFGINVDADGGGIFIKQLAEAGDGYRPLGDGRARLRVGQYLESIAQEGTSGLSREDARALIKAIDGDSLILGVRRPNPPSSVSAYAHLQRNHPGYGGGGAAPPRPSEGAAYGAAAAPRGWAPCADGGFVRDEPTPSCAGPSASDDPFMAFAFRGTDVPPAQPGRLDLPPPRSARVRGGYDRVPPC